MKFERKWAAKEYVKENNIDPATVSYETVFEKGDMQAVEYVIDCLMGDMYTATNTQDYTIYLTGEGNFREAYAKTHKYKGNRDNVDKPILYEETRKYLIDVYGAEVVNGMEADDALGIAQKNDTCIVTIDKDLDMIPGWHYNLMHNKLYNVDPTTADYEFYIQMLTGDTTDNIIGIHKVGRKTAEKILHACEYDEVWPTIYAKYIEEFGEVNAYDRLVENGRLLYILRDPEEPWSPPQKEELDRKAQSLQTEGDKAEGEVQEKT